MVGGGGGGSCFPHKLSHKWHQIASSGFQLNLQPDTAHWCSNDHELINVSNGQKILAFWSLVAENLPSSPDLQFYSLGTDGVASSSASVRIVFNVQTVY